ncbi:PHP domain-containing protein [bacterium]|nr:PHP domain-containing protein [bacterium]
MLRGNIDLHIHTTCSDGQDTPEEIVEAYLQSGYRTIAITDHDAVEGVIRGLEAARGTSLELIPGIELSSVQDIYDIHILGYFIDYEDCEFRKRIAFFKEKRHERAEEIVKNLNYLGLDIQLETVLRIAHGAPIGRPHIAEALLSEELITTYGEAFARYIGDQGPAYVPKYKVTPGEAIELINENGGISVLAHPGVLNRDEFIFELMEYGLTGLEAIHPLHPPEKQMYYEKLARKYGLIVTGGSDWHGKNRRKSFKELINSRRVPQKTILEMKSFLKNRKRSGKRVARTP